MAVGEDDRDHRANGGTYEPKRSTSNSDNEERDTSSKGFAEYCNNPPPQLAVENDCLPEPVDATNQDQTDGDDNVSSRSTRPVVRPDIGDPRGPAVVYAEPDRSWIAKHKTWVITGLIVAVIVMVGVTVGVVEVERGRNGSRAGGVGGATSASTTQVSSSTPSAATGTSSIGTATTPSSTGSASSTPSACTDTSSFLTKVSWMGIADATGGWSVSYAPTSDAISCCTYCYQSTPAGCNSWAWIPDDASGSAITACNIIFGWKGINRDENCPSGYTSVHFSQSSTNASHVGAAGPCASVA